MNIKKLFSHFLVAFLFMFFLTPVFSAHAQTTPCQSSNTNYCLLAPLPGLPGNGNSVDTTVGIESYINTLIKILIGLMSVLAVIMIVVGGIQYMVSSSGGEKQGGKDRITNALMGLVLALSAYLILNTINPHLVNLHVGVPNASLVEVSDKAAIAAPENGYGTTHNGNTLADLGIFCPTQQGQTGGRTLLDTIIQSFAGKVIYSSDPGTDCPVGKACMDCSRFVNLVLECAGLPTSNPKTTTGLFSGADAKINSIVQSGADILINGIAIKNGDVVGWKPGDWSKEGEPDGHAMIYLNGSLYEVHGPKGADAWRKIPFTKYDEGEPFGTAMTSIYRTTP